MGIHPSIFYRWKRQLDRHGPEILRLRERRPPRMANQTSVLVEQRVVAFALGHPGFGPGRIAAELARPKWGEIMLSTNGCGPSAMGWSPARRRATRAPAAHAGTRAAPAGQPARGAGPAGLLLRHQRGLGLRLGDAAGDPAQSLGDLDQSTRPAGLPTSPAAAGGSIG
jgi:hypothetical protein